MEGHAGAPTRPSLLIWNLALSQSSISLFHHFLFKASVWLRSYRLLTTSYVVYNTNFILQKASAWLHSCRLLNAYNNIFRQYDVSLLSIYQGSTAY